MRAGESVVADRRFPPVCAVCYATRVAMAAPSRSSAGRWRKHPRTATTDATPVSHYCRSTVRFALLPIFPKPLAPKGGPEHREGSSFGRTGQRLLGRFTVGAPQEARCQGFAGSDAQRQMQPSYPFHNGTVGLQRGDPYVAQFPHLCCMCSAVPIQEAQKLLGHSNSLPASAWPRSGAGAPRGSAVRCQGFREV